APAMRGGAWATPSLPVSATATLGIALRNVPVGPVAGAVKVTITPGSVFPKASRTTTDSGVANAGPEPASRGAPVVAVMALGAAGARRTAPTPPIKVKTSAAVRVQAPAVLRVTLKLCVPPSTSPKV